MAVGRPERDLAHAQRFVSRGLEHLCACTHGSRVKLVNVVDAKVCDIAVIAKLARGGNVRAAAEHERDVARTTEPPIARVNVIELASEDVPIPPTGSVQVMNRQNRRRGCNLRESILPPSGPKRFQAPTVSRYSRPVRDDATLMRFARAIVRGDQARALGLLAGAPELALACIAAGATRNGAEGYFLAEIPHILYAGDTALHIATAAYEAGIARELVDAGASVAAANRRGARPLHYAVDGIPGSARWNPVAQRETVLCLLELGADPNAVDKNGTAPLHRAVRNRCAAAVEVLLDMGADPQATNRSGSTAVQLARWTTGRGGSGSAEARAQQQEILRLLRAADGV
jgi:hypothetical protein